MHSGCAVVNANVLVETDYSPPPPSPPKQGKDVRSATPPDQLMHVDYTLTHPKATVA